MTQVRVYITLKKGVLDPQGQATERALAHLGFEGVQRVTQGKLIDLHLEETDPAKAKATVEAMCEKLLANTVIEDYDIAQVAGG